MIPCFLSFHLCIVPFSHCLFFTSPLSFQFVTHREVSKVLVWTFFLLDLFHIYPPDIRNLKWLNEWMKRRNDFFFSYYEDNGAEICLKWKTSCFDIFSFLSPISFPHNFNFFFNPQNKKFLRFHGRHRWVKSEYCTHTIFCWGIGNQFNICHFIYSF